MTRKGILKVLIIIILAVFLISTGLMSVMYLGGKNNTNSDQQTGDNITGTIQDTGNIN